MQEQPNFQSKSDSKKKPGINSPIGNIDLSGVAQEVFSQIAKSTSKVVQQAASILEEEVAAGIVAARNIEDKMFDTKDLRKESKDALFSRFRRDAHEVVDIFVDLVGAAAKYGTGMTKRLVTFTNQGTENEDIPVVGTPKLEMPVMKPGTTTEVPMTLENKSKAVTDVFSMFSTDLISNQGKRIAASNISFSPQSIRIDPAQAERVEVKVTVPKNTPPGSYSGLVQATNMDQLQAILIVIVE
jgi:hypothetical protein